MSILQAASEAQVERQAAVELAGRPADEMVEGQEAAKVDRRESGEESSLPPPPPSATTPAAVPAQQVSEHHLVRMGSRPSVCPF